MDTSKLIRKILCFGLRTPSSSVSVSVREDADTKKRTNFLFGQTDRPTDRQTLWFIGKLNFQKPKNKQKHYDVLEVLLVIEFLLSKT